METRKSWNETQDISFISEETGILKMSDGYTLHDLEILMGWDMYLEGSTICRRGMLGFDYRKTTPEMMAYMDGVINALAQIPSIYY